ncbi:sorting and assembly machinery component 50 homolog isoform X2 [Megachile rotundata]|uniref:sorting and assembly machinery component 50 homolog isoform X2 n=1 Tax=Megachile rotundata TaxID=143995 RepID=UPI000614FE62|nr:PREDICTED: sorting and assembly machinery component 50 homolog isoform X2 [Megachile rotundata]
MSDSFTQSESKISENMNETSSESSGKQNFKGNNPSSNFRRKLNLFDTTKEEHVDLHAVKVRVDKIHVDGLGRTKDDIIKSQVTELFKAKDFYEVLLRASRVKEKLRSLGCFKNIGIFIDTSQGPDATPEGVEVTFSVHEMRRLTGGINTMVGNNEGSVIIQAKAPNLCGRGEHLQMEYSYGSKSSTNISVSLVKPFVNSWLHTVLTTSVFNTFNRFPWSGFNQYDKGLLLDFALNPDGAGILKHNLQYEANYREIVSSKQTSFRVREQCGPNLKSALRHICCIDKRDSLLFPTAGSFVQFSTEVAGLGGDIGFVKNELIMQTNWTPHEYFTFQLGLQSGLLRGINNEMKVNIADQFFLGGPLNLRGFEMRGCGPRDDGYSIGGDAYWAVALHLYTPLPFRPGRNGFGDLFKLHGFINGGNVSNFTFKFDDNYKDNMKIFTENVRCSAGGGIAMKLGNIARVELNFIMPLLFLRSDVLRQFQFGIGVQYL